MTFSVGGQGRRWKRCFGVFSSGPRVVSGAPEVLCSVEGAKRVVAIGAISGLDFMS